MEKDIKTIKERLSIIESLCTDDCINKTTVIQPLKYAIENLIARNKELEKQLQDIHDNFCKFNWKESNGEQVYYQLKELYESIYRNQKGDK